MWLRHAGRIAKAAAHATADILAHATAHPAAQPATQIALAAAAHGSTTYAAGHIRPRLVLDPTTDSADIAATPATDGDPKRVLHAA